MRVNVPRISGKFLANEAVDLEFLMNIYVGNLSYDTVEDDLRQAFENYGEVTRVNIVKNRDRGYTRS